ncbi:hypothetical protein LTR08_002325 [Meristemomyces frigidus]|nr:hypothetical protein LTR08_002325 [Meristemomyces frigidus]
MASQQQHNVASGDASTPQQVHANAQRHVKDQNHAHDQDHAHDNKETSQAKEAAQDFSRLALDMGSPLLAEPSPPTSPPVLRDLALPQEAVPMLVQLALDTTGLPSIAPLSANGVNSPTITAPPRINFPLPRELRDEIYGYLLSSEYAKDGMTYNFHTSIMAVNHALHDETEEYLYKNNVFVVFSCNWEHFVPTGFSCLPLVATKNVGRMEHHSSHFHLGIEKKTEKETPVRSILILAQHVEGICHQLHIQLFTLENQRVCIISLPGKQLHLEHSGNSKVTTSALIELRTTKHRNMTVACQQALVLPLHSFISEISEISFRGAIADASTVEAAKSLMKPALICMEAKLWSLYSIVLAEKAICDALVTEKFYDAAADGYMRILFHLYPLKRSQGPSVVSDATAAWRVLTMDLCLSNAWLAMRKGSEEAIEYSMNQFEMETVIDTSVQDMLSTRSRSALHHLYLLASTYLWKQGYPDDTVTEVCHLEAELKALMIKYPDDRYVAFDEAEVTKAVDAKAVAGDVTRDTVEQEVGQDVFSLDMCSASRLTPRVFDSSKGDKVPKKPDSILGWQDLAHLASLSAEENECIREAQADVR